MPPESAARTRLGLTFVDYDQDGDLDLYVTRFNDFPLANPAQPFAFPTDATRPGNILWRNKGNGTFMDWTKEMALAGSAASVGRDRKRPDEDRVRRSVCHGLAEVPVLILNQREGTFRPSQPGN